ncbi:MAG: malate synthase G [Alphaproteobacteria bacterium]
MAQYESIANIQVGTKLVNFINQDVLPGTGITASNFWNGFAAIVAEMMPKNAALLEKRDLLQRQIDEYWQARRHLPFDEMVDAAAQKAFLSEIGYLHQEGDDFEIETANVDDEVANICGPQLVVPVMNARYALNAANARWGSLYDALYGTDAILNEGELAAEADYNPKRGAAVIEWARNFLDQAAPLQAGSSHKSVRHYHIEQGKLVALKDDDSVITLADASQFIGFTGKASSPSTLILKNNGLHIIIKIDPTHIIGKDDMAGISDIMLEAALTTIMDCEDSVAAVDEQDKIAVYRNWLGLMQGDLSETVQKGKKQVERTLAPDLEYQTPTGEGAHLKARSLMLIRNVGHLMTNPAILTGDGAEIYEGIMDAAITALIALHDLKGNSTYKNSQAGSMYIVKPKMHGPEEVAFACDLFSRVEELLEMPANTLKIGIMDEERRTTLNLKEAIRAAKSRVFFINTGFLDRTGDEIHTAMQAGAMIRKNDMKQQNWIAAYEDWNVDIGLLCGFSKKAQIGKGMWAMPDQMAGMLATKLGHLKAGGNTAWVPSPTAAVLHATHYHQLDVFDVHAQLIAGGRRAKLEIILQIPVAKEPNWQAQAIEAELENNCQGLLGYVVRWVNQGVGCSKVPDVHNIGLMEDRATLRISSQHLSNWLLHNIVDRTQIRQTMEKMAKIVDEQNASDPAYQAMAPNFEQSTAFQTALALVYQGIEQPSGYTEPLLHHMRLQVKK